LEFKEGKTRLNIRSTSGFEKTSVGYVGASDGWQDLNANFQMDWQHWQALNGNVAGTAKLLIPPQKGVYEFYVTYDFGGSEQYSTEELQNGMFAYEAGWQDLIAGYKPPKFSNVSHE